MEVDRVGVHATHCCLRHGCKYGYGEARNDLLGVSEFCPVEQGDVKQEYPCEYCDDEEEPMIVHDNPPEGPTKFKEHPIDITLEEKDTVAVEFPDGTCVLLHGGYGTGAGVTVYEDREHNPVVIYNRNRT